MKLSLEADPSATPAAMLPLLFEAIVRHKCVSMTYNRTRMILAPHILYTRHDAVFLDAVVVSKEGFLPREEKVGTFKLDGLKELTLLERDFAPSALFDPSLEKYQGVTLIQIEAAA
ncbi:WYL domain-containing protein [Sphingomonas sp. KR3-1]|uniref:WYL domain-containing protein n=1 Tax=Sphingomonas sp. KR3-1 TaxID=3156611 RepID=UPI0032B43616